MKGQVPIRARGAVNSQRGVSATNVGASRPLALRKFLFMMSAAGWRATPTTRPRANALADPTTLRKAILLHLTDFRGLLSPSPVVLRFRHSRPLPIGTPSCSKPASPPPVVRSTSPQPTLRHPICERCADTCATSRTARMEPASISSCESAARLPPHRVYNPGSSSSPRAACESRRPDDAVPGVRAAEMRAAFSCLPFPLRPLSQINAIAGNERAAVACSAWKATASVDQDPAFGTRARRSHAPSTGRANPPPRRNEAKEAPACRTTIPMR